MISGECTINSIGVQLVVFDFAFMGVLPDTQYGDVASIDTGGLSSRELPVQAKISSSSSSSTYLGEKISPSGSNFSVNAGPSAVVSNPLLVS